MTKSIFKHIAEGTYREDRHGPVPSTPDQLKVKMKPESWLTGAASSRVSEEAFEAFAAHLEQFDISTKVDALTLSVLADTYAQYVEATLALRNGATKVHGRNAVLAIDKARSSLLFIMKECGLTPTSKSRFAKANEETHDPALDYFKNKQ